MIELEGKFEKLSGVIDGSGLRSEVNCGKEVFYFRFGLGGG